MLSRYTKQPELSNTDAWTITKATVTSCRPTFLSEGVVDETGGPASPTTYIVTFEYEVNGTKYRGKMRRDTPVNSGHHFEISYDSRHPSRNTGSDFQMTYIRVIGWATGAAVAGTILYFQNR